MGSGESVRVDGVASEHRLGEVIAGRVWVGDAERVSVALVFETSGSCDPDTGVLREVDLGACSGSVPFTIDGPTWPPTYHGTLFAGDWDLVVSAVIAGKSTTVRHRLRVVTDAALEIRAARGTGSPQVGSSGPRKRLAVLVALEAICAALVVIGVVAGSSVWIVGAVAGAVLALPTIGTTLGVLAHRAGGGMDVDITPTADGLAVRAQLGRDESLEAVSAALVVRESAQRFVGYDHPERREHVIHEHEVPLAVDGDRAYSATLPITTSMIPTFSHSNAQVGWSVHVRAEFSGAPALERSVALVARPATGPGSHVEPRWTTG